MGECHTGNDGKEHLVRQVATDSLTTGFRHQKFLLVCFSNQVLLCEAEEKSIINLFI